MKKIAMCLCTLVVASTAMADVPAVPSTPAAIDAVLYARPFALEESFTYYWNKDRPQVTSGTLLVLKVDPQLVIARQLSEPVLFVGDQTAQRVNQGDKSGRVIAIVPGKVDLTKDPIWFGTPQLPERVDAATISTERAKADVAKIKPLSAEQAQAATERGGAVLNMVDLDALLRGEVSELILEYSAEESKLVEDLRVPVVGSE